MYISIRYGEGNRTGDPVQRRKRLRKWRWSSYRGYSGLAKAEQWVSQERVLGEMGGRAGRRRLRYVVLWKRGSRARSTVRWKRRNGRRRWAENIFFSGSGIIWRVEKNNIAKFRLCDNCDAGLKRNQSLAAWREFIDAPRRSY